MEIYDISVVIDTGMVVWPGDSGVALTHETVEVEDAQVRVTRMALGVHTGTHVDAPLHFLSGAADVTTLALSTLIGPAQVYHLPDVDVITAAVLTGLDFPPGTERVLFRTRNSTYWAEPAPTFHPDFVGVALDAAAWLIERGVRLIGVDYLSVSPYDQSVPVHTVLLQAGVILLEGLNLNAIEAGRYHLICLPLKLQGSDGSPARAVLTR